jgi:hypothetical protein
MKVVRICIFALILASIAFAEEGLQEKSHYLGGRFAFGLGYVWDNEPVRGTFGSAKDGVEERALGDSPGTGIYLGASYMYRLNHMVGLVGEAEFRMVSFALDEDAYSIPPEEPSGDPTNFHLYVYSFAFPVMARVFPSSAYYLEAGAQFDLNMDASIMPDEDCDDSFDFDAEQFGWSLVLGAGFPLNGWQYLLGARFVMDMTRIEKDGIVEMTKGAAYREASPMKVWSLQFSFTAYFL